MVVKFHNTLTNENEEFKPRKESAVTMYNCGPTVYDYATIGNLRAYVFADSIKRVLKYSGYDVKQVINIRSEERRVGKECRSRWSPYH